MGFAEDARRTVLKDLKTNTSLVKDPLNEKKLAEWGDALTTLAANFMAGGFTVDPKSYPSTCKYCVLPSLCRVAEVMAGIEIEDDLEEEDVEDSADA
jgi:ATP-dependent helicase/nuclease subunit B